MYRHSTRPILSAAKPQACRHASTKTHSPLRRGLGTVGLLGGSLAFVAYYYDSRSIIHEHVAMPIIRATMDAEQSHRMAIRLLGAGAWARPKDKGVDDERLSAMLWDKELSNPVGIAAGFDKDAEAIDGLFDLGFGYVEIGSVTPLPQPGNPKPRFFRLEEDNACINRYGFNSAGHRQTLWRLQNRIRSFANEHPSLFPDYDPSNPITGLRILPPTGLPKSLRPGHLLAVNLGKNKTSAAESNDDYISGVKLLGPYADVLVINVSSPNTPGLRSLQSSNFLTKLLQDVTKERDALPGKKEDKAKVVVKIAPDLGENELEDIARAVRGSGVEGVIVSNTTVKREGLGLISPNQHETGGLSGTPIKPFALLALKTLRPLLPPSIPIIGCGGISSGADAIEYAQAGASIVQAYTAFGYQGIGFPRKIKDEMTEQLSNEGESWKSVTRRAERDWSKGVEKVGKDLLGTVQQIKSGADYTPWEDLLAERGMGGKTDQVKKEEIKAIPFGSADAATSGRSEDSPFAPHGNGVVPAVTKQLSDFLGRAQQVMAHPHLPNTPAGRPSSGTSTIASPSPAPVSGSNSSVPSTSETLEIGTGKQEDIAAEAGPAIKRESPHLTWINEVTRGERRMV